MNPVIESLLGIVDRDPLPVEYASSHWQRYGRETIVERRGDDLVLRGSGFGVVYTSGRRWRIVHALERLSYRRVIARLNSFASVWRTATDLARDLLFDLTFDVWKQSGALAVLTDHWRAYGLTPKIFALIGDGYGFLGALIRRCCPGARIYCIDLPKTLVFQVRTHERVARDAAMSLLSANGGHQTDTVFVLPGDIELIPDQIDCAVNIASMQEMNVTSIASYFAFLRRRSTPRSRSVFTASIGCGSSYLRGRFRPSPNIPGREMTKYSSMANVHSIAISLLHTRFRMGHGCLVFVSHISITLMVFTCIAWHD